MPNVKLLLEADEIFSQQMPYSRYQIIVLRSYIPFCTYFIRLISILDANILMLSIVTLPAFII